MKKALSLLLVTILSLTLYLKYFYKNKNKEKIIMATMSGWAPYVYINKNGEYEGFDIEIAKKIAEKLEKKLEIIDMDTVAIIEALKKNKADFAMTDLGITKERLKEIDMIKYQNQEQISWPLVFWEEIPKEINELKDFKKFKNKKIAVEPGSTQESFLLSYNDFFEIVGLVPSIAINELKNKNIDAILIEENIFLEMKKSFPQLVKLDLEIDDEFKTFGTGIGINKNNNFLKIKIEEIIETLKISGELKNLENIYLNKN